MKHLKSSRTWFLVLLLPALFVVLASLFAPLAYAQPTNFDCSSGCASWQYWNGTTQGAKVQYQVSNPTLHNTSFAVFDRITQVYGSGGAIHAGIEKILKGSGGYCPGGGGLFFFAFGYDRYNDVVDNYCQAVPSACVNQLVTTQISPFVSSGGGMEIQFYSSHCTTGFIPQYFPTSNGIPTSFGTMKYVEQIYDTVIGHDVWGVQWLGSSYMQNNTFQYQARGPDFLTARNPPQMYWLHDPAPGNGGGDMRSCDYDAGTSCTLNG